MLLFSFNIYKFASFKLAATEMPVKVFLIYHQFAIEHSENDIIDYSLQNVACQTNKSRKFVPLINQ
jgi:hypothetical protein